MQVPAHQHISTEVHLFATAGFRILSPRAAADLIESCRSFLAISRFKFSPEWATVMSGTAASCASMPCWQVALALIQKVKRSTIHRYSDHCKKHWCTAAILKILKPPTAHAAELASSFLCTVTVICAGSGSASAALWQYCCVQATRKGCMAG